MQLQCQCCVSYFRKYLGLFWSSISVVFGSRPKIVHLALVLAKLSEFGLQLQLFKQFRHTWTQV